MSLAPPDLPTRPKCIDPIPVPTHGAGGVFSVACTTTISAPAKAVLAKVLDLSSYEAWNTFVPSATLTSPSPAPAPDQSPELRDIVSSSNIAPGARIRFQAVMVPGGSARAVDLEVTFLETFEAGGGKGTGYRVVWKAMGFPHFLLHSERVQEFVEDGVGEDGGVRTRYLCWETFGGWLAYLVPRTQLEDGFGRWMDGLKGAVEGA
ncbi:hypothetical protein GGS21DRAFT_217358 [Xylaria nigripes]|nr:hypothetical protein GGS21DRAFT_217358 [Xylaria nigripes]